MMPAAGDDIIRLTGGQIDGMVMALIDCAHDKDDKVKFAIIKSLEALGQKQPNLVLSSCHSYLIRHKKLPIGHRVCILNIIEQVCSRNVSELDKPLVVEVIKQSVMELITTKDMIPEWQTVASNILVALGKHFHNEVMESLLVPFQPGVVPHFYVVQTLANLATSNPYGIVPFLKAVLSSMMPMLGAIKQENLKMAFAQAISKFSESILDYLVNIDKAPDKSVRKEVFSNEINTCYDVLFNVWLNTRDLKLKWSIVNALGQMSHLMSKEKIEEQLPRLISGILSLYKKHQEHYNITQGLCMVLESAANISPTFLAIQLDTILATIFPQVCHMPDYSQPESVKNHNEVLRCFDVLVKNYSEQLVYYLLMKLDAQQERSRIGSLMVLKHLINSSAEYLSDKMLTILSGVKPVLNDQNNKVKKVMAYLIVAMAHHGYFECPGSQVMLDFIIRQCSLPSAETPARRPTDVEHVSNESIRLMCENILHLLATTVQQLESVLWPMLLEYLVLDEYASAIGIICKCAAQLANKKRDEQADDYEFNYNKYTNVPRPHAIIARLIALVGNPHTDESRAVNVIKLMKGLCPVLEKDLLSLWDTMIPQLLNYLKETSEGNINYSQKHWEDMILKLLSKSLDEINKEDWTLKLGNQILKQFHLYNNFPKDKNMVLKALGVVMRKTHNKQFLTIAVSTVFSIIKHTNDSEREGCAVCMGLAAAIHTDTLLVKLEEEAKADQKKNSGLFSFIKDMKGESEHEKHHATFILCYGFLALYAPTNILISRIESPILRVISKFYNNSKDTTVRISLIHSIDLVAQALHPSNLLNDSYILKSRGELLNQMLSMLKHESVTSLSSTVKALAMNACSSLLKLPPNLSGPTLSTMIQTGAQSILSIPAVPPFPSNDNSIDDYQHQEYAVILDETLSAFNNLLVQILLQDFSSESLDFIIQNLNSWLLSNNELERERTVMAILHLLKSYQENLNSGNKVMLAFMKLGNVLGCLIPRCTDPIIGIRGIAIQCIQALLQISAHNLTSGSTENIAVTRIDMLKEGVSNNDPSTLYSAICDFAKIIVETLPSDQIRSFVFTLIDGLEDSHSSSSSGTTIFLKSVLTQRGNEIRAEAVEILDTLHGKLSRINCAQTRVGAYSCVHALASHHMAPVVSSLLSYYLPYDEHDTLIWRDFAKERNFAADVLNHLLELLSKVPPYTKHQDPRTKNKGVEVKIANQSFAAAICSITELFRQVEMEQVANAEFHRIFSALLLAICSFVDVYPPLPPDKRADPNLQVSVLSSRHSQNKPVRWAIDAMKSFLFCSEEYGYHIMNDMTTECAWDLLDNVSTFPDGVSALAKYVTKYAPPFISRIISILNTNANTVYENQRIGVVSMSAELINQKCDNDHALLELLMNSLISKLVDPSHVIRRLCIKGLSSVGQFGMDEVHKYSTTVLSAMMAGMDDRDDPDNFITLEAMGGLSKVLIGIDEAHIKGIQINIALKMRPMIEKEQPSVRAAAVTLFGDLSRVASGQSKGPFVEQIHNNFVTLLLHLNDSAERVVVACKSTLKILGPMLDTPKINSMFQKHLIENRVLRYSDFINDLSKEIIAELPEKVNFYVTGCVQYFKSEESFMQGNAVFLAGCLLGNLPEEMRKDISKEHICGALIMLLKDSNTDVKMKAAESMSLLYSY